MLLDSVIHKVEADLKPLEEDMSQLAAYSSALFEKSDSLVPLVNEEKFLTDDNGFFYNAHDIWKREHCFYILVG